MTSDCLQSAKGNDRHFNPEISSTVRRIVRVYKVWRSSFDERIRELKEENDRRVVSVDLALLQKFSERRMSFA